MPVLQPEAMIRPGLTFSEESRQTKTFVAFVDQHSGGSLPRLFAQRTGNCAGSTFAEWSWPRDGGFYACRILFFGVDARRMLERSAIGLANAM
jgi:hypothetical protein